MSMRTLEKREYQIRIIDKTVQTFDEHRDERGGVNVLIESPPGSGKTVMGLSIMQRMLGEAPIIFDKPASEVRFGWVSMRRNLLRQAAKENDDLIQCPNIHWISMFDDDPPKCDMLIVDEAQHDAAASCAHIHSVTDPKFVLGLSATPFRTDSMKLCFDRVIKDAGYHRLIQDGWLAQFNQYMMNEYTPESVAKAYLKDKEKWGKSVMYFLRIADCEETAKILRANGVKVEVVTGQTDRYKQMDKFDSGEVDILINVYVLSEGFDCPSLKTVFVRDSSKGPTIQMAGRVLRKHDDIPVANIVQSVNTRWPFVRTASPHAKFIEKDGDWASVGSNELVEIMRQRMLQRIMNTETIMPAYIIKHTKNQARELSRLRENMRW